MIDNIIHAISLVVTLKYFWSAMACSTIMAGIFGASIYDGEVPHAKKGVLSVLSYIFMMILTMGTYIVERYPIIDTSVAYQLFVYPIQLIFLSFFWALGFISIILIFRWRFKKGHYEA